MVSYLRSTYWSCFCIPYSVFVFAPLFALLVTVIVMPHSYSVFRIRIRINDGSHILGAYPYYVSVFRICSVHCWAILWARLRIPYSVFVFRICELGGHHERHQAWKSEEGGGNSHDSEYAFLLGTLA